MLFSHSVSLVRDAATRSGMKLFQRAAGEGGGCWGAVPGGVAVGRGGLRRGRVCYGPLMQWCVLLCYAMMAVLCPACGDAGPRLSSTIDHRPSSWCPLARLHVAALMPVRVLPGQAVAGVAAWSGAWQAAVRQVHKHVPTSEQVHTYVPPGSTSAGVPCALRAPPPHTHTTPAARAPPPRRARPACLNCSPGQSCCVAQSMSTVVGRARGLRGSRAVRKGGQERAGRTVCVHAVRRVRMTQRQARRWPKAPRKAMHTHSPETSRPLPVEASARFAGPPHHHLTCAWQGSAGLPSPLRPATPPPPTPDPNPTPPMHAHPHLHPGFKPLHLAGIHAEQASPRRSDHSMQFGHVHAYGRA